MELGPFGITANTIHPAPAGEAAAPTGKKLGVAQMVASPVAVGTALFYAMASLNIYAMLVWLPTILQQHLGLDRDAAGAAFGPPARSRQGAGFLPT